MRWWHELRYLARKLDRRRAERELEEEIQTHLALDVKEKLDEGYSAEEARYAARRAFGSVLAAKEKSRAMWGFASFDTLWQDLRGGGRMLWKRPGFASTKSASQSL